MDNNLLEIAQKVQFFLPLTREERTVWNSLSKKDKEYYLTMAIRDEYM